MDTDLLCVFLAPISINTLPQVLKVSKGSDVTFNCSASGPSNLTISWKASGIPILPRDGNITITTTLDLMGNNSSVLSTLTIFATDLQDQGSYSCIASSKFASDEKPVVTLTVVGKA